MTHMVWGDGGLSCGRLALLTSLVVMWYISVQVSVHWFWLLFLEEDVAMNMQPIVFIIFHLLYLGASLLWFGWFGFNAGSALKADGLAAHAFMTSAISAAAALLSWMFIDTIKEWKNDFSWCSYRTCCWTCCDHSRCRFCSNLVFFHYRCTWSVRFVTLVLDLSRKN